MDRTADTQVETLEAKGLIRVASYRPELEYLFRHWLVQDAAYESLLKQERRELHRQVGDALESLYPDRRMELAGILAMHFEQAGETDKAIAYYINDARYALERNAIREAFAAAESAARLLPVASTGESDARRRARVEVAVLRARAGFTFEQLDELTAGLDAVIPIAEELGDLELLAELHLFRSLVLVEHGQLAGDVAVTRSLDRLRELSSTLDDPSLAALPMAMLSMNKVHTGPIREGVDGLRTAIPLMESRRDFIGAAFARGWLAMGHAELGEFDLADQAVRDAAEAAADGDLIAQLDAQIAEAMVRAAKGELDETLPLARACVERSEATGATACAVVSAFVLGDVLQRRGAYGEAREALQLGLGLSRGITSGSWGPTLQAYLRFNSATMGDIESAAGGWDEALATVRAQGNHMGEATILWKRADVAATRGQWEEALADYRAAAAIFEAQGSRPTLARVLRASGTASRAAGSAEEAEASLRRSMALFEEMGLAREAGEVRAELAGAAV